LEGFAGTVVFTSHDRHFMHRVATCVIEVRAGRVASYPGSFDEYVYRVQSEIDSGLRSPHATSPHGAHAGTPPANGTPVERKAKGRSDRDAQKKLKAVERKIAKLDEEKKSVAEQLLTVSTTTDAKRLQSEMAQMTEELAKLEEEWLELSAAMDEE
jgi:ATP-binding cassette subfamily F protein 3